MDSSTIISASALILSVVSFVVTLYGRRLQTRMQEASFDVQRDTSFEARLADWPGALKFHGIDLKAAAKEKISAEDIAYLVLSVGAFCSYCTAHGKSEYDFLKESDYRQRMFAQIVTRRTWKYARLCFPKKIREGIERFIAELYGETYAATA